MYRETQFIQREIVIIIMLILNDFLIPVSSCSNQLAPAKYFAGIAQSVEHPPCKRVVMGSSPITSTI